MRKLGKLLIISLIGVLVISVGASIWTTQGLITYQTNYWDFYTPFSDIYIKEMVRSGNGSIVYLYPDGSETFSFVNDGTIRKEIGTHFIECTRAGGGKYITITDTDIPFLPKINPFTWGTPIGNTSDFKVMKELFKIPREGECYTQVDLMVELAQKQGIIARRINLWQSPINGMLVAGGHTTMEVYDRETKQWIWMAPSYNIIEGKIKSKPITLLELQIAVNNGENITLTTTDGKEIQFDQWEHAATWKNYLNPSQVITYVIPENTV
jgi:hypothetical protein